MEQLYLWNVEIFQELFLKTSSISKGLIYSFYKLLTDL